MMMPWIVGSIEGVKDEEGKDTCLEWKEASGIMKTALLL